jgi:hypothetical protein
MTASGWLIGFQRVESVWIAWLERFHDGTTDNVANAVDSTLQNGGALPL